MLRSALSLLAVAGSMLALASSTARAEHRRYDGHMLIEAELSGPADLETIRELSDDLWTEHIRDRVSFRLAPEDHAALRVSGIEYRVLHHDLQQAVEAERLRIAEHGPKRTGDGGFDEYLDLEEYWEYVEDLAELKPDLVSLEQIGYSLQGRKIRALRIGEGKNSSGKRKPAIIILSGHHAREWLAHHATLCVTERLIRGYDEDDEITRRLEQFEYTVISMGNPDGYNYTWTRDRFWRKNRGHEGKGVDLNRNWDWKWGTASSDDPDAQDFHGSAPFSEPETQVFSEFIADQSHAVGFIDIHAYGSLILYPYGTSPKKSDLHDEYIKVTKNMANAMRGHGDVYEPKNIMDFVGRGVSGSSVDWVHQTLDGGLSLAFEVRGDSFEEPFSQVERTCDEIMPAILEFMAHLADEGGDDDDDDDDDDDSRGDDGSAGGDDEEATGEGAGDAESDDGCEFVRTPRFGLGSLFRALSAY